MGQFFRYAYAINPTNFFSLPEEKQKVMVTRFLSLLNSMEDAGIVLAKEHILYDERPLQIIRTYIASEEQIDGPLESLGFKYHRVSDLPVLDIQRENAKNLTITNMNRFVAGYQDNNNKTGLARCFTLYSLRSSLQVAWVYPLLNLCDMVIIRVRKVDNDQAVTSVKRYSTLVNAAAEKRPSLADKAARITMLYNALLAQQTALFKLRLNVVIMADNLKELAERSRKFKKHVKAMEVRFDGTAFKQFDMLPSSSAADDTKKNEGGWWGEGACN